MEIPQITLGDIEEYLKSSGKRGASVLSILGKINPYFNAVIGTSVGREILSDMLNVMDELMMKIYQESATEQEKAEFRVLRDKLLPRYFSKVKFYIDEMEKIKKSGSK